MAGGMVMVAGGVPLVGGAVSTGGGAVLEAADWSVVVCGPWAL